MDVLALGRAWRELPTLRPGDRAAVIDFLDDEVPVESMWDSYTIAFGLCEIEEWLMLNCEAGL
ncbi:MAG: hypothetical protein E6J91_45710 [Deltaproteobacteria bacterium]|nr:MAG: hypothetical protein E6J91_45710 [Deltaproteobacteria bacterium]